ncbi:3-dehydroquinate synthase [Metaclostridioides mangenotii]|uniref:3-dehydroquinate synthase n=1 Tax=Metaclostridioides mangenotii TaxID=1540 RepID=A0ABS4E873_9FIRM|nr:3-dehydroquinate synthase [Clostridioides mangenotii]MBP1854121.1 3-dehydroquinate synthase [Clostridioides mangenotii]
MKRKVYVNLEKSTYCIRIENNSLDSIGKKIKKVYQCKKAIIITDENVNNYYTGRLESSLFKNDFDVDTIVIEPGEMSKSLDSLPKIYNRLIDFEVTRNDLLIALGGGVVGDICGFVASSFLRGIPFIQIPTSLLAQVDSSVGGKVGINLERGKNLVGSFYHPKAVFIDPLVLNTLPDKYYKDGMAEVIKYGCIKDKNFFYKLKSLKNRNDITDNIDDIIYRCCSIKKKMVESDERDLNERMILNFGHTLGHAIEKYYNFEKYTHGEAVAIGMYNIALLGERKGLTKDGTSDEIKDILIEQGLAYKLDVSLKSLMEFIKNDKKNIGSTLKVVLLKEIGESFIYDTTLDFFEEEI